MPYCASARSFGFKKSSFEKIKGYSNTVETLSGDDDLLLREAVKNNLKVGAIFQPGGICLFSFQTNVEGIFPPAVKAYQSINLLSYKAQNLSGVMAYFKFGNIIFSRTLYDSYLLFIPVYF